MSESPAFHTRHTCAKTLFLVKAVILAAISHVPVYASPGPNLPIIRQLPCGVDNKGKPMLFNTSNPGHEYSCLINVTTNTDGSEDIVIAQPVVDRPNFEYSAINFSPGDLITIKADGCVQTGGVNKTWKRYVNSSGPHSGPPDGLYFGQISIKGAAWRDEHRIAQTTFSGNGLDMSKVVEQPGQANTPEIFIQDLETFPGESGITLFLGYKDDNYTDHGGDGYWGHDDGDNGQCRDTNSDAAYFHFGGPAWVKLHVVHNQSNPFGSVVPHQWDLVQHGLDTNGIPINPEWGWQVTGGLIDDQGKLDPSCLTHGCTSQDVSFDSAIIDSVLLKTTDKPFTERSGLRAGVCGDDGSRRAELDSLLESDDADINAVCASIVSEAALLGRPTFESEEAWISPSRAFEETLDALFLALQKAREQLSRGNWKLLCWKLRADLSLCELLHQDPMTARAYDKPRGYAGDAVMMDYLYGLHSSAEAERNATELGRRVFRDVQSRGAAQAVRFRRKHLADVIDQIASQWDDAKVLAVASGHLREAELSKAVQTGALSSFVALDVDAQSIAEVKASYSKRGVETIHASVRQLLSRKHQLGQFNLVYASGLYDYLADNVAQALTGRLFELTAPGGTLLIPNFSPSVSDRGYMECFMDWHLFYRDEYEMDKLLSHLDGSEIENFDIYSDPTGAIVFISVRKQRNKRSIFI